MGLGRQDFGHIDIRTDHSIVELPAALPAGTLERLRGTRISGQLIELTPDRGPGAGGSRRPPVSVPEAPANGSQAPCGTPLAPPCPGGVGGGAASGATSRRWR